MVPVTFAVVEYLSHRFTRGGKDLTMDSTQNWTLNLSFCRKSKEVAHEQRLVQINAKSHAGSSVGSLLTLTIGCRVNSNYVQVLPVTAPEVYPRGADEASESSTNQESVDTGSGRRCSTNPNCRI